MKTSSKFAIGIVAAALALSACAYQGGSAATIGDQQVSEAELATQVQQVLRAQGKSADTVDQTLATQVLDRLVKGELVDLLAGQTGVTVTPGQVDAQLQLYDAQAGGRKEVERLFAESGVAPEQIPGIVELNLKAAALGAMLVPDADQQTQGDALVQALGVLSQALDTQVSPQYGTWNPQSLSVGEIPNDLSVPMAGGGQVAK